MRPENCGTKQSVVSRAASGLPGRRCCLLRPQRRGPTAVAAAPVPPAERPLPPKQGWGQEQPQQQPRAQVLPLVAQQAAEDEPPASTSGRPPPPLLQQQLYGAGSGGLAGIANSAGAGTLEYNRDDPRWLWRDQARRHAVLHLQEPPAWLQAAASSLPQLLSELHARVTGSAAAMVAAPGVGGGSGGGRGVVVEDGGGDAALHCLHQLCWHRCTGDLRPQQQQQQRNDDSSTAADINVSELVAAVSRSLAGEVGTMESGRLAFMLRCLGLLNPRSLGPELHAAAQRAQQLASEGKLPPDDAASCLWAIARLDREQELQGVAQGLGAGIEYHVRQGGLLHGMSAVECAMLLWAMARMGLPPPQDEVADALVDHVTGHGMLHLLPGKCVVMVLWACATLGMHHDRLLSCCADAIEERLQAALLSESQAKRQQHPPLDSGAAAGALAEGASASAASATAIAAWWRGGVDLVPLLPAASAGAAAAPNLNELSMTAPGSNKDGKQQQRLHAPLLTMSDVCNALWALGRVGFQAPRLAALASSAAASHADDLLPRDLPRLMWGLTRLGEGDARLFALLWPVMLRRPMLRRMGEAEIDMVLRSAVTANYVPDEAALKQLAVHLLPKLRRYRAENASSVAWAYARFGCAPPGLYNALAASLMRTLPSAQSGCMVVVAQAFAKQGISHQPLFELIARRAAQQADSMSMQDLLRLLMSFSSLEFHAQGLVDAVDGVVDARLRSLPPASLSMAMWVFAKFGGASDRTLAAAEECVSDRVQHMTARQLSVVAWSFAKLEHRPSDELLLRMTNTFVGRCAAATSPAAAGTGASARQTLPPAGHALSPPTRRPPSSPPSSPPPSTSASPSLAVVVDGKAVSNMLWGIAKVGGSPPVEQLQQLADLMAPGLRGYTPQSLANILWAYAKFGLRPEGRLLPELTAQVAQQVELFDPVGIGAVLWGLAVLDYRPPRLLPFLVRGTTQRLAAQFEPRELANTLWGFSKLRFTPDEVFMGQAQEAVTRNLQRFSTQELFNVLWALAKFRKHRPTVALLDGIADEMAMRSFDLKPQELAGSCWAYAKLGHHCGTSDSVTVMMDALLAEVPEKLPSYDTRHVVTVMWAAAQLRYRSSSAMSLLAAELAARGGPAMMPQDLAMTVQALGQLRYHPGPGLLAVVDARAADLLRGARGGQAGLRCFELAAVAQGFALLGEEPAEALDAAEENAKKLLNEMQEHGVLKDTSALYWSLVLCGRQDGELALGLAQQLGGFVDVAGASRPLLARLEAARRVARVAGHGAPDLRPMVAQKCERAWQEMAGPGAPAIGGGALMALQGQVAAECKRLGLPCETLARTRRGAVPSGLPPLVMTLPRGLVALQVVDSRLVTWGEAHQAGGDALAPCMLLQGEGYDVVMLTQQRWEAAAGASEQRQQLLRDLLADFL